MCNSSVTLTLVMPQSDLDRDRQMRLLWKERNSEELRAILEGTEVASTVSEIVELHGQALSVSKEIPTPEDIPCTSLSSSRESNCGYGGGKARKSNSSNGVLRRGI